MTNKKKVIAGVGCLAAVWVVGLLMSPKAPTAEGRASSAAAELGKFIGGGGERIVVDSRDGPMQQVSPETELPPDAVEVEMKVVEGRRSKSGFTIILQSCKTERVVNKQTRKFEYKVPAENWTLLVPLDQYLLVRAELNGKSIIGQWVKAVGLKNLDETQTLQVKRLELVP